LVVGEPLKTKTVQFDPADGFRFQRISHHPAAVGGRQIRSQGASVSLRGSN
jgi:hypothetical protein